MKKSGQKQIPLRHDEKVIELAGLVAGWYGTSFAQFMRDGLEAHINRGLLELLDRPEVADDPEVRAYLAADPLLAEKAAANWEAVQERAFRRTPGDLLRAAAEFN